MPVTKITRPKEGKYTYVVMGSSPEESFPETAGMMRCKFTYNVNLRIGLRPDWILLFCPPGGAGGRIEAPYPYLMLRPELEEFPQERIFVHGWINESGRLEQLTVPEPVSARNRELLLESLRGWELRPASRNGSPVRAEILVVIPRPEP